MCAPESGREGGQKLEVADIFRTYGEAYRATHRLSGQQLRVMRAIEACRTPALGHQTAVCDRCGTLVVRYHSCGNHHCPKCQTLVKVRWVEARTAELLPVPYFHGVFTLPHGLTPLLQGNPRVSYSLLFRTAAATLQAFGHAPKWLGGDLGITMVLHTWGQNLDQHVHVHCVVTGGALSPDQQQWMATKRRDFLFPVRALSKVFRAKYLEGLYSAFERDELHFGGRIAHLAQAHAFAPWLDQARAQDWVVYAKPPFSTPRQYCSGQLVCAILETEVYGMENTITTEVSLKTPSDYEAAIEQCLAEMQRLHEEMERDQEDIDRLRTETKALLAELKTG
jgi:hypothetical protein